MKIKNVMLILVVGIVLGFGAQAYATSYSFTFTDTGGISVTGTLDVTGGFATSGTVATFTGGALVDPGGWSLATPTTLRTADGTDIFAWDNAFPINANGLTFQSGVTSFQHANYGFSIWQPSLGVFSLFESGQNSTGGGHVYAEYDNGTFTYSAVSDGGMTLTLLGTALLGLAAVRRKLRA